MVLGLCVKGRADLPKEYFLPKCTTIAEDFTSLVIKESLTFSSNPEYHPQLELLSKNKNQAVLSKTIAEQENSKDLNNFTVVKV